MKVKVSIILLQMGFQNQYLREKFKFYKKTEKSQQKLKELLMRLKSFLDKKLNGGSFQSKQVFF